MKGLPLRASIVWEEAGVGALLVKGNLTTHSGVQHEIHFLGRKIHLLAVRP